jgi:putative ABC transport system permease protein
MKLGESVRISWRAITGHKLRSTLTTLGVVIGVGSVITFMVLGGGFEQNLLGDIEADNEPIVTVQTQQEGSFGFQFVDAPIYTQSDIEAIEQLDGVAYVVPDGDVSSVQLSYGNESVTGIFRVQATTRDLFATSLFELTEGQPFASEGQAVVNEPTKTLFGGDVAPGDEITVSFEGGGEATFTVSGIVDDDIGGPPQPVVYVPLDPYYTVTVETSRGTEERAYSTLQVGAEDIRELESVQERVQEYFENGSDARQLKQEEHTIAVQTVQDVIDQFGDIIDQLTVFIGGIAGISLLVGSIGIANIMIVSVTERTREIGIMKAVGARKRDIIQLFLVEAIILGVIGAAGGVVAGLGVGFLLVSYFGWPMAYPLRWIAIAVAVGLAVGILAGLYPAWRAARVDPIEALRRE